MKWQEGKAVCHHIIKKPSKCNSLSMGHLSICLGNQPVRVWRERPEKFVHLVITTNQITGNPSMHPFPTTYTELGCDCSRLIKVVQTFLYPAMFSSSSLRIPTHSQAIYLHLSIYLKCLNHLNWLLLMRKEQWLSWAPSVCLTYTDQA